MSTQLNRVTIGCIWESAGSKILDTSLAYGLAAAFCWGSADFVAKIATARIGYLKTAFCMQLVGVAFMSLIVGSGVMLLEKFPSAACIVVLLGVVNAIATLALYKGFEVGKLSIVSPIASSYPALSSILALVFLNERVSSSRYVGIACIFVGMLIVSLQSNPTPSLGAKRIAAGAGYALIAFAFMGILFFGVKIVVYDLGGLVPVLVFRIASTAIFGALLLLNGGRAARIPTSALYLIGFVGVVDSLANVAYNIGVSVGTVAVVSFVSSLFSVVTLLLAVVMLKERLSKHQVIGIILLISGIAVIGYLP